MGAQVFTQVRYLLLLLCAHHHGEIVVLCVRLSIPHSPLLSPCKIGRHPALSWRACSFSRASPAGSERLGGRAQHRFDNGTHNPLGTHKRRSALDVGCAVGGASFELTRTFDEVVGIDFSHAFVAAANDMKAKGEREYQMLIEGSVMEPRTARVPAGTKPDRAHFEQVRASVWVWVGVCAFCG